MHEVWITGAGALSALGSGLPAHGQACREGRSGLSRQELFAGRQPDPCMVGKIPGNALDPDLDATAGSRADLIAERVVGQALTHSGCDHDADLAMGTTLGNIYGGTLYYQGLRAGATPSLDLVRHFLPCSPTLHAAKATGLQGRRWAISSACGSGTAALGLAWNRVRRGRSRRMVAAGADPLSAYVAAGFNSLRLVSTQPCRPFDAARDGLSPGEGGAAFVLERCDDATRRKVKPLARIEGFGEALDAFHHTRAHPEGAGLVAAAAKALAQAGIGPGDIGHAHLHGTGTQANDTSEYCALKAIFGERLPDLPVCSTKSMTGHTFGGAGALSAAFCLLTLEQGLVPPTLFLDNLDPAFAGLNIANRCRTIDKPKHVLSLALGFGGEAFALVLGRVEQ